MKKHTNKDGLTIAEGQLVSWYIPYMKKTVLTVVTELKESVFNEDIILICGNWSDTNGTRTEHVKADEITGVWDIVDFRKVPTKQYKQLVAYHSNVKGRLKWGVYDHTGDDGEVWAYWEGWDTEDIAYGRMSLDEILRVEDIIIHEEKPKAFTFSDFDASVKRTWKDQDFKDAVSNAALGLTGEAGEVADLIKKAIYHGRGFNQLPIEVEEHFNRDSNLSRHDVKDELSDVLYYVSATAQEFGFTLEDVAKHNKEKLEKRFPEGFSTVASAQKADKHPTEYQYVMVGKHTAIRSEDHFAINDLNGNRRFHTFVKKSERIFLEVSNLMSGKSVTIESCHEESLKFSNKQGSLSLVVTDLDTGHEVIFNNINLEEVQK
ncbi:nucleoside triphosphate pyrophosphohydrolase family protein [Bacillus cereus]|uniref:nucleoside triphosphate pyrophosphohydrolase family protein n=1 Tax=Bacillus cereus TaxID=1396 RepID=UPI001642FDB8|nr:nucleoside triphosphate pyrophosphohydrolase family protein [Bacillus cereus]